MNYARALAFFAGSGALCGALVCEPAYADYYAFGNTQGKFATLALNGANCSPGSSAPNCLSTNGVQGWVETGSFNPAGPASNTNYIAGLFNGSFHDNFFGFGVTGAGHVTSAALIIYSGDITSGLDYSLRSVVGTGFQSALETAFTGQNKTIYSPNAGYVNDIGSGAAYATQTIGPSGATIFDIALNGLAVSDINAAIHSSSGLFAIGGTVAPDPPIEALPPIAASVPEPSSWILMLAGFAGLGLTACRRNGETSLRDARRLTPSLERGQGMPAAARSGKALPDATIDASQTKAHL